MPLFEYCCRKCKNMFEELVHKDQIVSCPECGSKKVEKQISVFSAPASSGAGVPECFSGQGGCSMDKCGSGRCGLE